MPECDDIPAPRQSGRFSPDEVTIYGTDLSKGGDAALKFDHRWDLKIEGAFSGTEKPVAEVFLVVVAYAYAYEGHCYRFDKPKILAFPTEEQKGEDPCGCGFEKPCGCPEETWVYRMWRLKASKRILELSASVDKLRMLVLEANLPGKRAPGTYRGDMQLAHRSGRLTSS